MRVLYAHQLKWISIPWNLVLATIPAFAGAMFARATSRIGRVLLFAIWLLFLPNAPYILTDFVHLEHCPPIPLWYDVAVVLSAAGTGLLLGYSSVADVQGAIARAWGRLAGWIVAIGSLLLTGFGIYLGRFLRWNSWDPLANPRELFEEIARKSLNPTEHPRTVAVTLIYGVVVTLGYIALRTLASTFPRERWAERR